MSSTYRGTGVAGSSGSRVPSQSDLDAAVVRAEDAAVDAESSASAAQTSENNAATSETNAATSETNAAASETGAETAETNAETAETNAETAETNAASSASAASTSETNAATSETNAGLEAGYAEEWAITPEDTLVSTAAGGNGVDDYSALHWAAKADAGSSYTKAELDAGQLDNRYYTETEADANYQPINRSPWTHGGTLTTTSGTAHALTGLPTWITEIRLLFKGVSSTTTTGPSLRLGPVSGVLTSGYVGQTSEGTTTTNVWGGARFILDNYLTAAAQRVGVITLTKDDADIWYGTGIMTRVDANDVSAITSGYIDVGGTLERIEVQVTSGAFDAGSVEVLYR